MEIQKPYLLFLGDAPDALAVKTAAGILDWRAEWCIGQMRLSACKTTLGLDDLDIAAAKAKGAKTLVIGVVNPGGVLPTQWVETIVEALMSGLDVASGMHSRLADNPQIADAAKRYGRQLFDVRHADMVFPTGKGIKRSGMRLLTVGTDCAIGKKYTALALEKEMHLRGMDADFRATGQTGVLISGRGVAVDAVVADFIAGAAEWLSPAASPKHWDIIEGQGSLFHPSFAGVTLGLLHGSQPDAFVVCHEPTRKTQRNVPASMPSIGDVIDLTVRCGQLTNPHIRCVGIAINTSALDDATAKDVIASCQNEYKLPANDPLRFGVVNIVDHLVNEFGIS